MAAEGLCLWVKAIEFYHRISRIVGPKKEKLRQAEILVKTHLKQLEVKRKALQVRTNIIERRMSESDGEIATAVRPIWTDEPKKAGSSDTDRYL